MTFLAVLLTSTLGLLATLHVLWAIGYWTPIREEAALAKAVVGTRSVTTMPGAVPCALVAVALLFAAVLPHQPAFPARDLLMPAIGFVFLARGVAAFLPIWHRLAPEKPFATLDRALYGPLCLMIGIGYLILAFGEF